MMRPDQWDHWTEFKRSVDWSIQTELRGERPLAGAATWNEYWVWRIASLRESKEKGSLSFDYDQAVAYILQQRRKAGLPELE